VRFRTPNQLRDEKFSRFLVANGSLDAPSRWVQEHHGPWRNRHMPASPTPNDTLIDINVVAARLGVQVRHVRRLVHERRIPYVKWGHLIRFDPADIAAWIEQAKRPAAAGELDSTSAARFRRDVR